MTDHEFLGPEKIMSTHSASDALSLEVSDREFRERGQVFIENTIASVHTEARAAWRAGLSVAAPTEDGTKRPDLIQWKEYQTQRVPLALIRQWYPGRSGLGIFCGQATDDSDPAVAALAPVEAIDFDSPEVYRACIEAAEACELVGLIRRIESGYTDDTPRGVRWVWRCDVVEGNQKLAERPPSCQELAADPKVQRVTLIENRGQGGYAILAPSNGRVHPTGRPYVRRSGGFSSIVTITPAERATLLDLLRSLDQMPPPADDNSPRRDADSHGLRPGDDFNTRATWLEVLEPHGWTPLFTRRDGVTYWRRPGKSHGWSATTNVGGSDRLCVFSTSTVFETVPGRSYDKFGALGALEHGGDLAAAASALATRGYGSPRGMSGSSAVSRGEDASALGEFGVQLADFHAYLPSHRYVYSPTRELWPGASVNGRVAPIPLLNADGSPALDDDGKPLKLKASQWLDRHRSVEQMT